jgi:hypothetical protein
LAGQGIGTLSECVGMNGFYLSSSSAAVVPGFWFLTWTKAGTGYLDSETHQVLCDDTSAPGCVSASACANDNISPGVRNSVSQLMQRASEPPDWSVFATAAPYLVPEGGNVTAVLLLSVGHHTTSGDTKTDIQLASMGTLGPLFQGPDLPALSLYAPLDKLAVAWIQPRSGGGEELVVQRYQMCF